MPKLNKGRVQHRMAEMNVTSTRVFAAAVDIPWGSLKNALAGRDPLTLVRIYRIARLLRRENEDVRDVVRDILQAEDVPDSPPDQPKPEKKPERRKERSGKGPKRDQNASAA